MKYLIYLPCLVFFIGCSKKESATTNLPTPPAGSYFIIEQQATCNGTAPPTYANPSKTTYIRFVGDNGELVPYQPLPNKWYKVNISLSGGGLFVKMGADVTPKEYVVSANNMNFGATRNIPYATPCIP
jgi:hypothetical protein